MRLCATVLSIHTGKPVLSVCFRCSEHIYVCMCVNLFTLCYSDDLPNCFGQSLLKKIPHRNTDSTTIILKLTSIGSDSLPQKAQYLHTEPVKDRDTLKIYSIKICNQRKLMMISSFNNKLPCFTDSKILIFSLFLSQCFWICQGSSRQTYLKLKNAPSPSLPHPQVLYGLTKTWSQVWKISMTILLYSQL